MIAWFDTILSLFHLHHVLEFTLRCLGLNLVLELFAADSIESVLSGLGEFFPSAKIHLQARRGLVIL